MYRFVAHRFKTPAQRARPLVTSKKTLLERIGQAWMTIAIWTTVTVHFDGGIGIKNPADDEDRDLIENSDFPLHKANFISSRYLDSRQLGSEM